MTINTRKRSVVVSLIGRPNTGKSTIFNRLMRKSFKAMTHDQPGVTRDRHYGIAKVEDERGENSQDFILVDTGGFYPEKIDEVKELGKKKTAEPFFNIMAEHAKLAIAESDLILMVVDVREGMIPFDKTICDYIRTSKKRMVLLVNKFDSDAQWGQEADFYELGLHEDDFLIISAEHARGLEYLREKIYHFTKNFYSEENYPSHIQKGVTPNHNVVGNVAIIGAPNAGKSTLLNQFLGAQRALVSDIAGTTVDPIEGYFDLYFGHDVEKLKVLDDQFRKSNTELLEEYLEFEEEISEAEMLAYDEMPEEYKFTSDEEFSDSIDDSVIDFKDTEENDFFDLDAIEKSIDADEIDESTEEVSDESFNPFRSIKLVDTAGIRKQNSVTGFIEEQSVYRSLKSITEADVVLYMVDATKGITHQDRRLCDIALEKGKSIIICLNKIDLIRDTIDDPKRKKEWLQDLRATIPWLSFCEIITISAMKGSFLNALKHSLRKTIVIRNEKVTTGRLNKIVSALVDKYPVVLNQEKGTRFKVKYVSMLKAAPPTFLFFTNRSKGVPTNYKKYLKNGLRREFEMVNTPVHLIFRTTTDIERRLKKSVVKEMKNR